MPRIPRFDCPNCWHHVMSRGIARRTLFENEPDIRTFLSRLALRVRAGQIELHAFCILTTHYHLLVRSLTGELSAAMCEVHREYSRWFNRTRRRDGPLFRGRFVSKPVDTLDYREQVVRYIDFNPVSAGLVAIPSLYPHGSARSYASARGPIWLCRTWVEETVTRRAHAAIYDARDYPGVFGEPLSPGAESLLEKRLALRRALADPLAHLIGGAHGQVLDWMRFKAQLADGMPVGMPVCDPDTVQVVIADDRRRMGEWTVRESRKGLSAWPQVSAALLRDLCGLPWNEIGIRLGASTQGAWRMAERHRRLLVSQADYAERVAGLAGEAVRRCHGKGEGGLNR
jgi:REP element-mobilizing transposase RayT